MTAPRFTAQGKQVLFTGSHYADACDETAAIAIVTALNAGWQAVDSAPKAGDVRIPLSRGLFAWVSPQDAESILESQWYATPKRSGADGFYAVRGRGGAAPTSSGRVWLHRQILSAPDGVPVDHIDGDGLNCTRQNLRIATRALNAHNRAATGRCRFRGVSFDTSRGRWKACISNNGRTINLGRFDTAESAAIAYDHSASLLYGHNARLNFPDAPTPSPSVTREGGE